MLSCVTCARGCLVALMKRSASIAALPHIRMSESLPAAIEVHLRAFDAETVVDQDVHMVFGEDAAAVYLGEASGFKPSILGAGH